MVLSNLKIGVLMGGYSSEREISLKSGRAVFDALQKSEQNVVAIDITEKTNDKIAEQIKAFKIDVAFIALHGVLGEDGQIQRILERLNIPYAGSGVQSSQLAINKIFSKNLLKNNGIPVPEGVTLTNIDNLDFDSMIKKLAGFPLVVKPACGGSSIGIHLVRNKEDLQKAIIDCESYGQGIIIEEFIKGRELTVGILADKALPVIEIHAHNPFFDYEAKYQQGKTDYSVPAQISEEESKKFQSLALRSHHALGCEDLSRVDFMYTVDKKIIVLEVNTIPGFTATSLLPKAARIVGYEFNQLCLKLVELAYGKKKEKTI